MPTDSHVIELSLDELREVAGFAARCAGEALPIFEGDMPGDPRPREVIDVLNRYPAAPPGGGRVGELMRLLDSALRGRA